jgi:phosphatidate cytidylyltransferase
MLKNRVITALVLAPLIIAAILLLPPDGFALVWGLIILAGAFEWTNLAGLSSLPARLGFVGAILAVFLAARVFAMHWAPGELPPWFYWPAVAWWAVWGLAFRRMPEKLVNRSYPLYAKLLAGAFVLITAWVLMVWLRLNFLQYQVLYLVLLIWLADIAAYFVGKRFGRTKLVEPISPGKTVEGVYGALFAAALLAVGVGLASHFEAVTVTDFVFLSLFTVAFSVCGDLFESLAKRVRGVKDSGGLLPGHGGVLDRIDSLLAAVAVFYAGSLMLGIFLDTGSTVVLPDLGPSQEIAPMDGAAPSHGDEGAGEEGGSIEPEHQHPADEQKSPAP